MSTPFHVLLPRALYKEMIAQAVAELPNECCGMLAGVLPAPGGAGGAAPAPVRVSRRFPLVNASHSPREYNADPRRLFEAVRACRQQGLEFVAVYHSHPTTDPVPSRTDLERNFWPGTVSFIISLHAEEPVMKGWWLGDADYAPAAWELVE